MTTQNSKTLKCSVTTPTRIDLAGGTLDIWPLAAILQEKYELWNEPVRTVNVAIDLLARADVTLKPSANLQWQFVDADAKQHADGTLLDSKQATPFPLHRSVARFFADKLVRAGLGDVNITTQAQAPRGSGLGGSSSLMIAMLAALDHLLERDATKINMCRQARHLEAGVLGNLAGNQDHFAAAFGGVQAVTHGAEGSESEPIDCNGNELMDHLVLAFSGQQHFSAFNNWQVLEKVLTGNDAILTRCAGIARIALDLPEVLRKNNWREMARMMSDEWELRRGLDAGISTTVLDAMLVASRKAGSVGGKVCGAGGGGVLVTVLPDPGARAKVSQAIESAGGLILNPKFAAHGIQITR